MFAFGWLSTVVAFISDRVISGCRGALLVFLLGSMLLGDEPDSSTHRPLTSTQVLWLGQSQMIAFERIGAGPFVASIDDPSVVEILGLHPGEKLGQFSFVRLRALTLENTTLRLGSEAIAIEVRASRTETPVPLRPRLRGVTNRACVWGEFGVGVDVFDEPTSGRVERVELSVGSRIQFLDSNPESEFGPFRHYTGSVDCLRLEPRSYPVFATVFYEGGRQLSTETIIVHRIPEAAADLAGECEDPISVERPRRFGKRGPIVRQDPNASGGAFVSNAGAGRPVCVPVSVTEGGFYQSALVVGGSHAGGAYPAVGIYVDDEPQPRTSSCLLESRWHRIAVGRALWLDRGEHILTFFFLNDFYVPNRVDRNLALDRYEIRRVDPKVGENAADYPFNMGLHLSIATPTDGTEVSGDVVVRGECRWRFNPDSIPEVTLVLNGRELSSQKSTQPIWWLSGAELSEGDNSLELRCRLNDRRSAVTATQTLKYKRPVTPLPSRDFHRFAILEEAWDEATQKLIENNRQDHRAAFFSPHSARLKLPEDLEGEYEVYVEGAGDEFEGPPEAKVRLFAGGQLRSELDPVAIRRGKRITRVGLLDFSVGPKRLEVAFENDRYVPNRGDRNLRLYSVILSEVGAPDQSGPAIQVLYPKPGASFGRADAVVVQVRDNTAPDRIDLVIDGERQGMNFRIRENGDRVLLPVLLGNRPAGEYRLQVWVSDDAGQRSRSSEVIVRYDPTVRAGEVYERAISVLNRFAGGPDPSQLAGVLVHGPEDWLRRALEQNRLHACERNNEERALGYLPDSENNYHVEHRRLRQMLTTQNPALSRLVYFLENHFSTWIRKTGGARFKWDEYRRFAEAGAAPFKDLLYLSATSPAMLFYLDQTRSFAGAINENYAREIMELHTLGVDGGYRQADVTQLARFLTGWSYARESSSEGRGFPIAHKFRYDPRLSDLSGGRFLGIEIEPTSPELGYDRIALLIELLAAHPSTARFLTQKLASHYGVVEPGLENSSKLDGLAKLYLSSGGDLRELMLALVREPIPNRERLTKPIEYAVRLARVSHRHHHHELGQFLRKSGMGPYDRATPDGYPEADAEFIDTNALLQRWQLSKRFEWSLRGLLPPGWLHLRAEDSFEEWRERIITFLAVRLTGLPLDEESHQTATALVKSREQLNQQILDLAVFIAQSPEAQMK